MITISIAEHFSRTPGARFPEEGKYSGQEFREEVLMPALKKAICNWTQVTVILDGTAGLSAAFLEEAFGGLIREEDFKYDGLKEILILESNEDESYIDEINYYLLREHKRRCKSEKYGKSCKLCKQST